MGIKGKPVDPERFMPFEPVRVLNYYDGPRIFTFSDADGALCLACWSDEDETHSRFLVVQVTDRISRTWKAVGFRSPRPWAGE